MKDNTADLVRGLHMVNRLAKATTSEVDRRAWYALKAEVLGMLVQTDVRNRTLCAYEQQRDGSVLVVVTLMGSTSGCWHIPLGQLSDEGRAAVERHIGPPFQSRTTASSTGGRAA